ncbi:MAG: hypothetical protein IT371_30590 [Deltaproteobacteria bacterium]|nr:hypothetical protein [Deltaproteobacteria bacterium]
MSLLPQIAMPMPNPPDKAKVDAVVAEFREAWGAMREHQRLPGRWRTDPGYKAWLKTAQVLQRRETALESKLAKLLGKAKAEAITNKIRFASFADNPADRDPDMPWQRMRAIVHAGKVRGRPLTDKQRRFFMAEVRRRTPNLSAKQARALAKAWAKRTGEPWKGNPVGGAGGLQAALRLVASLQGEYDAVVPSSVLHKEISPPTVKALVKAGLLSYDDRYDEFSITKKGWKMHGLRRNPSGDERMRALERAAASGDPVAAQRLAAEKQRHGIKPVRLSLQRVRDTGEWRVAWMVGNKRDDDKSYYTDDKADAIATMEAMQAEIDRGIGVWRTAENPSADERRRLLEREAMRGDPLAAARLAEERRRTTADPALAAERLYLRDILKAWGVEQKGGAYTGSSSDGYVPSSAAGAGLRAVFKKAGIRAQIKTSGHGDLLLYWNSSADGAKLGRLFAQNIWERANSHTVHPNAREDRSDLMTDYYSPGGITLPQEYHATYVDAVRTALGQKTAMAEKREAKRDERRKAVMEAGAAPRANDLGKGERVVLHGSGGYDGTWEVYGSGNNMVILHRVGKTGKVLSIAGRGNSIYVSHKNWDAMVERRIARVAPRMNPPLAIIHNPANPHAVRGCRLGLTAKGGMTLDEARAEIESLAAWGHTEALREIVRRTRPRDRDKLVAEIQFAQRSSSQRSSSQSGGSPRAANPRNPIGHQRGGKREKISFDEAVAAGIDKAPGFKEAVAHYRKFHGTDPTTVEVYRYDDGRRERSERVVVTMGEVPETHYTMKPNAKSNKAGYHWVHKHVEKGKGRNPNLLFDPATGLMTIAGGTFKVTRWIYH